MRRVIFIATVVAFAQGVGGFSPPALQTPTTTTTRVTVRSVQVNSQTITALRKGKKYVADLTQRGVRYEFDAKRRVDFSRVMVRTAQGEEPIGSFLRKVSLKNALTGFNTSQSFSIGTRPAEPGPTLSPDTRPHTLTATNFTCNGESCICNGFGDCLDLIYGTSLCTGEIVCGSGPKSGSFCICTRKK